MPFFFPKIKKSRKPRRGGFSKEGHPAPGPSGGKSRRFFLGQNWVTGRGGAIFFPMKNKNTFVFRYDLFHFQVIATQFQPLTSGV